MMGGVRHAPAPSSGGVASKVAGGMVLRRSQGHAAGAETSFHHRVDSDHGNLCVLCVLCSFLAVRSAMRGAREALNNALGGPSPSPTFALRLISA